MADEKIEFVITADDEASGILGKVQGVLSGIGTMLLTTVAAGVAAAGAAILAFGGEAIVAASRVEELQVVLDVLAKNAGLSTEAVQAEASEVKSMGIEMAASQQIVAQFVQNQLDLASASDLARVAQDAAVIAGKNSTETTLGLIEGIITLQGEVLRSNGIFVDMEQAFEAYAVTLGKSVEDMTIAEKQQAALNAVLAEGAGVAGAYEAAMETASKQIRSWPRYVNDILVTVGAPFQEAFGIATGAISHFLKEIGKAFLVGMDLAPTMDNLGAIATKLATAFADWLGKLDFQAISTAISGFLDIVVTLFNFIVEYGPKALETMSPLYWMISKIDFSSVLKDTKELVALFKSGNLKQIAKDFSGAVGEGFKAITEWFSTLDFSGMSDKIYNFLSGLIDSLSNFLSGIDWKKVSEDLVTGINNIDWNALGEQMRINAGRSFELLWDLGVVLFEVLKAMILSIDWGALFDTLQLAGINFIGGILGLDKIPYDKFHAVMEGIRTYIAEAVAGWFNDKRLKVVEVLTDLSEVKEKFQKVKEKFDELVDTLKETIAPLMSPIREVFQQIEMSMELLITAIRLQFEAISMWIMDNFVTPLIANLSETWQTLRDTLQDKFVDPLVDAMIRAWNSVVDALKAVFTPIFEWVDKNVIQPVIGAFETFKKTVADAWQSVSDRIAEFFQPLSDFIERYLTPLRDAFMDLWNAASEFIDAVQELAQALADLVIPDWLTPGSPTPLELGIRGITSAMSELQDVSGPTFSAPTIPYPGSASLPLSPGNPSQQGSGITIVLNYSPAMSFASEREARDQLLPFVLDGIRKAQADGLV